MEIGYGVRRLAAALAAGSLLPAGRSKLRPLKAVPRHRTPYSVHALAYSFETRSPNRAHDFSNRQFSEANLINARDQRVCGDVQSSIDE